MDKAIFLQSHQEKNHDKLSLIIDDIWFFYSLFFSLSELNIVYKLLTK